MDILKVRRGWRIAFERAVQSGRPAVVDVVVECETDASMGVSLDAVREFA
jgi:glyoxylate carboligase